MTHDPDVHRDDVRLRMLRTASLNAVMHAQASQVTVRHTHSDGQLTFQVADDGTGFDHATTPRDHGLTNTADRLHALDGLMSMASNPANGTTATGSIPVPVNARVGPS